MPNSDTEKPPKDLLNQIEKMVRALTQDEQFELYKGLRTLSGDRRDTTRKKFITEVVYASERGARHEFSQNVSEGGIFIETPTPLNIGEKLSLTFPTKTDGGHLKLSGRIVRQTPEGIGVQFFPIDRTKRDMLRHLLDSL